MTIEGAIFIQPRARLSVRALSMVLNLRRLFRPPDARDAALRRKTPSPQLALGANIALSSSSRILFRRLPSISITGRCRCSTLSCAATLLARRGET